MEWRKDILISITAENCFKFLPTSLFICTCPNYMEPSSINKMGLKEGKNIYRIHSMKLNMKYLGKKKILKKVMI